MSADSLPVVKIDLSTKVNFHYFFSTFTEFKNCLQNLFIPLVSTWKSNILSFMMHESHFLGFSESLFLNFSIFDENIKK